MNLLKKLFVQHGCVDNNNTILWDKVAESPVLTQHVLLHITQCCDDAGFLPQEVVAEDERLKPIALSFCSQLVVPLKPSSSPNTSSLILTDSASEKKDSTGTLRINLGVTDV